MEHVESSQEASTKDNGSPPTNSGPEDGSSLSPKKRRKVNHGRLTTFRAASHSSLDIDVSVNTYSRLSMHLLSTLGELHHPQCYTAALGNVVIEQSTWN